MKNLIIFLSVIATLFGEVSSRVVSVDGETVAMEAREGLKPGMSAFVIREFAQGHQVILSTCIIGEATDQLTCKPFDYLEHDSLSLVKGKVQAGDLVRIGLLEKSMAIIAPDQKRFLDVKNKRPDAFWIHPDILAVTLKEAGNPVPKKKDFQAFCKEHVIGTLVFALEDAVYDVDCVSFKVVAKEPSPYTPEETVKPFYNRVGEIERGIFDFGAESIGEFTPYYQSLIGEK